MNINPFADNLIYKNDLEDFKMPYQLYGRTDLEIMQNKYMRLNNYSHGCIVRLGNQKNL